jgi:hypothetical protein
METKVKKAIEEYQCSGCIAGHNTDCFEPCETGQGCGKHYAGTGVTGGIGKVFLGMPRGFNRLGEHVEMKPYLFESFLKDWGEYNKFNIPVWKYLDKHGNTIVRGLQPRLNTPFIHVHLGDHRDEINCLEITENDLKDMD